MTISTKYLMQTFVLALILSINSSSEVVFSNDWQLQMLKSVNELRTDKGLSSLILCKPLASSAQNYAQAMAGQNFLSHTGKDGSTPGDRMQNSGYKWKKSTTGSMVAENIAAGQKSVDQVMSGWKKSKGHYKNIVGKKFTHVGFGQARNQASKYETYWVQNFGFGAEC